MTEAELRERYAGIRRRLYGSVPTAAPVIPKPEPVIVNEPELIATNGRRWREIVNAVTLKTGVTFDRMKQRWDRRQKIAVARQECWYRIRQEVDIAGDPVSYPQIGSWFGGYDHTSVIHGAFKWADRNGLERPR